MSIWEAIILGIIQGITEWLPVSSSGHLVIAQETMDVEAPIFFDVMVHLGTLFVVLWVFRKEVKNVIIAFFSIIRDLIKGVPFKKATEEPERRLCLMVIIGTIPTGLIGLIFKEPLESMYTNLLAVGIALCFTGVYLFLTKLIKPKHPIHTPREMSWKDAILIGIMQGVAIIPGVSRSGTTIATGLFAGLDKDLVTRYSFLLFIPAILGAVILQSGDVVSGDVEIDWLTTIVGMVTAMIVGYFAIQLLLKVIRSQKLYMFSYYCVALGLIVIGYSLY